MADRERMSNGRLFHSPLGLYPFQADAYANVRVRGNLIVVMDWGLGKQQPVTEPVLTPQGWSTMGELVVGDEVIGANGRPTQVLGVYPQGVQPVYEVKFSDGVVVRAGRDHLWSVQNQNDHARRPDRFHTLTTAAIADRLKEQWRIPLVDDVQFAPIDLDMDPYALGVVLGDGSLTTSDPNICTDDWIAAHLGWRVTRRHDTSGYTVYADIPDEVLAGLRRRGLDRDRAWEKQVPPEYLRSSPEQRLALLQGLLDTDGHPMKRGGAEFSSTSWNLIQGVIELTRSLGGVVRGPRRAAATCTYRGERLQGRPAWKLNVKLPIHHAPFRLPRKVEQYVVPTKYLPARIVRSVVEVGTEDQVCIRVAADDHLYVTTGYAVTHNTVIGMAAAADMIEDGEIDLVMWLGEGNKVTRRDELPAQFKQFTTLRTVFYHGATRDKRLRAALDGDGVDVVVSTYDTLGAGLAERHVPDGKVRAVHRDGPLFEALDLRHKRVLWILDEASGLTSRRTQRYGRYQYAFRELRKTASRQHVVATTANPMRTEHEDAFNLARLVAPDVMPTVGEFEALVSNGRDERHRLIYKPGAKALVAPMFQSVVFRKRNTDPDVVGVMPQLNEALWKVVLHGGQRELYDAVATMAGPGPLDRNVQDRLNDALRLTVAHPAGHLHSDSEISKAVVAAVGEQRLRAIGSAKVDLLVEKLNVIVKQQGAQALVFTRWPNLVLPELVADLRAAGFTVAQFHREQSAVEQVTNKDLFRSGQAEIMVSSDYGAQGLDFPVGYVVQFEPASIIRLHQQRFGRGTRLTSTHSVVWGMTMIAEKTMELASFETMLARNADQDALHGDTGVETHTTAADRRLQLQETM